MSSEPIDVLIAAYLYLDPARLDYQGVLNAGVKIEGAVCVSHDQAGELHVEDKDHLAGKGAEVAGGVGLVAELFAAPRLLARAERGLGDAGHHALEEKIKEQASETIPFGGAGLIVAYPRSSADRIDNALVRRVKKAVFEADGKQVDALKKAIGESQEKSKQPAGQPAGDGR